MIALGWLTACGLSAPPVEPAATGTLTTGGHYAWSWHFDPSPSLGSLFEAVIELHDPKSGAPVTDAVVHLDARMPQHGHGMETQPRLLPGPGCSEPTPCTRSDGVYRLAGFKFHMPGSWSVVLEVEDGPAGSDRAADVYLLE